MSELPKGWIDTTLGSVCDARAGIGFPTDMQGRDSGEVPFCKVSDISYSVLNNAEKLGSARHYISEDEVASLKGKLLPIGSTVFAKIGEALKLNRRAITTKPLLVDNNVMGLAPFDELILSKYLFYFMKTVRLEGISNATTVPAVRKSDIETITIPLAPLNEQKRIVAKLDELLPIVEACKQRLEKIPTILKRFRQSVLADAVSGKLTQDWRVQDGQVAKNSDELPATWTVQKISQVITDLKYGTSVKCSYEKEGVPVLRIPNVVSGEIDLSDLKYGVLEMKEFQSLKLLQGDLLLIRSNGSVSIVGRTALVKNDAVGLAYAGYLIRLRPHRDVVLPEYLQLVFSTSEMRDQIEIPARSTSGVNNINSDEVRNLSFALPPLDEQREIVNRVESNLRRIQSLSERVVKVLEVTRKVGDAILGKAFTGELVPQDNTDEPASLLIDRVKTRGAAKVKKSAPKKRKSEKEEQSLSA